MKTNILILLVLLGIASFAMGSGKACATSGIAPQTCDTQVWQTMAARARLETEREIMQNQNLIFKADSILTYTCFDSMAGHAAANIGPLFTHTTYFNRGNEIISSTGENSMSNAIQKAVIDSMTEYMDKNFKHAFLGGRSTAMGLPLQGNTSLPKPVANADGSPASGSGSYTCNTMNKVWAIAKCMNFMHATEFSTTDGFYPFKNLTKFGNGQDIPGYESYKDTRAFPTPCMSDEEKNTYTPILGSTWQATYNLSKNSPAAGGSYDALYQYGTPNNTVFTRVRERVEPAACAGIKPIKTGVKVILSPGDSNPYDDGICTNPGCTFSKNGGGTCVAAAAAPTPPAPAPGPTPPAVPSPP